LLDVRTSDLHSENAIPQGIACPVTTGP